MPIDLLAVYAAGLLTFVTPCVLPLIPIYLAALLGGRLEEASAQRGRMLGRAALFSVGFIAVFTGMGLAASSLSSLVAANRPWLQAFGALVILVFGLRFIGLIRLPLLDRVARLDEQRMSTRFAGVNAIVMGVVFAAGWSPCVGPVLGSVLSYTASSSASPLQGAGYLTVYGLGFATPLMLTAAFAEGGVKLLRRLGPHLPRIERVTGALLIVMALWTGSLAARSLWQTQEGPTSYATREAVAAAVVKLSRDDHDRPRPAVVEVYAEGCAACKQMQPLIDHLKGECAARNVPIHQVETSSPLGRALVRHHGVVGVPTFLLFDRGGHETGRLVGVQSEGELKSAVMAMLGQDCPHHPTSPAAQAVAAADPDRPPPSPCGVASSAPAHGAGGAAVSSSGTAAASQGAAMTPGPLAAGAPAEGGGTCEGEAL